MARASRATWTKRVADWNKSGLSGAEFAAKLGVRENTLRHWKWQLGHERRARVQRAGSSSAAFIEMLVPPAAQLVAEPFELILGDRRVRVPQAFDAAALRRLLVVLEER